MDLSTLEAHQPGTEEPSQDERGAERARARFDCAVWIAGAAYVWMVLAFNLYSPVFGIALILISGYEVIEPRVRHGKRSGQ